MNIAELFKRAVVRRVVYVFVALSLAYFGLGDAHAACDTASRRCDSKGEAYVKARAMVTAEINGDPYYTDGVCFITDYLITSGWRRVSYGMGRNGSCSTASNGNWEYPVGVDCPVGSNQVWDAATKSCKAGCSSSDPPLGETTMLVPAGTVQNPWANTPTKYCSGGCAYMGAAEDGSSAEVDGQKYITYSSMSAWGESCTTGSGGGGNGFGESGTPPSDGDGDGVSDGFDGSPNNPGQTSGPDGTPPGGPNKPEDGGGATCGVAGKPACPEDGSGKGSGNGNTSGGGGNCATPPTATGDAIAANVLYQTWATRCAIEGLTDGGALKVKGSTTVVGGGTGGDGEEGSANFGGCTPQGSVAAFACSGDPAGCIAAEQLAIQRCREQAKDADNNGIPDWAQADSPEIPGDGDGDYEEPEFGINVGTDMLDMENIFGSGSCPQFTLTSRWISFNSADIPAWCTLVAIMRAVVLLMGAYAAIRILLGGD